MADYPARYTDPDSVPSAVSQGDATTLREKLDREPRSPVEDALIDAVDELEHRWSRQAGEYQRVSVPASVSLASSAAPSVTVTEEDVDAALAQWFSGKGVYRDSLLDDMRGVLKSFADRLASRASQESGETPTSATRRDEDAATDAALIESIDHLEAICGDDQGENDMSMATLWGEIIRHRPQLSNEARFGSPPTGRREPNAHE